MRAHVATLAVALTTLLLGAAAAVAAPTDVHVRIEGTSTTIFDRVIRTDGHDVRATSDTKPRPCDGTNAHPSATPGPSATAAAVDALATLGESFDGQWYDGLDDYFVTRLGPAAQDDDKLWWWGVLVNRVFSPVGGCQAQLHSGDDVLWALDAFGNRPFLWLAAPASTVLVGQPLAVGVSSTLSSTSSSPTSGLPYAGAHVDAMTPDAQPAAAGVADGGVSGADGSATVVFHQAGWQRVKARDPGPGGPGSEPVAIASNSIDVCVEATPGAGCAGAAPSQQPVVSPDRTSSAAHVRLARPRLTADARDGRFTVRWKVLDAGPGIRRWTIASEVLGVRGARFVTRTSGVHGTQAHVTLPAGVSSQLRLSVRDAAGRTTSIAIGRALAPRDDRARGLHFAAGWSRAGDRGAWRGTVTRGGAGAQLRVALGAGRPTVVLRGGSAAARVELRAGRATATYAIARGHATRTLRGARRGHAGAVVLKVLSGTVSVDGVGLAP